MVKNKKKKSVPAISYLGRKVGVALNVFKRSAYLLQDVPVLQINAIFKPCAALSPTKYAPLIHTLLIRSHYTWKANKICQNFAR